MGAEREGPTHQVVVVGELGHGGALAAGDDERVEADELLRLAHLHAPHPDPPQRCTTPITHPHPERNKSTTRPPGQAARGAERERRGIGVPYRPGARCRSPAARGRPPPPLPPFVSLPRLVGSERRRGGWWWWWSGGGLVTSRGRVEGEGGKKPHVAEAAAATRG